MLECQNLVKTFHLDNNPENDKKALCGVSLTLNEGDFVSVIGGNGSGKTTLLNLIAGVFQPDSGKILLDGNDISEESDVKRAYSIGRVFQDPMMGTIASISLFENLAIAEGRNRKPSPFRWALDKKKEARFKALLAPLGLGLEDRLNAKMGTFSGGQRQSVTLLMASLANPKILLLDEHTAALDPKTAANVMNLTNEIVTKNRTPTLMITHNMKDAIAYGNRLIMMKDGQIVFAAEGEEKKKLTIPELLQKFTDNNIEEDGIL
jgi:putative ABC transport system ATP-binding protein